MWVWRRFVFPLSVRGKRLSLTVHFQRARESADWNGYRFTVFAGLVSVPIEAEDAAPRS